MAALALGAASLAVLVGCAGAWRGADDPAPDDWGDEAWWAGLLRVHALTGALIGALGLALAVTLALA